MTNVRLDDGRIIDPRNFEIRDRRERRLNMGDKLAIWRAQRLCHGGRGQAVVLATRRDVVGKGYSLLSPDQAIDLALAEAKEFFKAKGGKRPSGGIAAVLNFAPVLRQANVLSGGGVDVLFLYERIYEDKPGREDEFITHWMGPRLGWGGKPEIQEHILVFPRVTPLAPKYKQAKHVA